MRLQAIKLAGFKSFVEPTTIKFPSSLCAVVGPNGCGKSNIIDAVRWVMGESSAKTLRGESMADVIFNGSNTRSPLGQASIELIFDNSSGRLEGEWGAFSEISVRRLVTRDGQSSYFLNKNRCRRKDVMDLFLGTGLGPRSYSIIEQGMISQLIDSKPEELRSYLEEAAGISKYKERRKETERRIKTTRENLDRLNDIREELSSQLKKLSRQSRAAEKYNELRAETRRTRGILFASRWKALEEKLTKTERELNFERLEREKSIGKKRALDLEIEGFRNELLDLNNQLNDSQRIFYDRGTEIARLEEGIQFHRERVQQYSKDLIQVEGSMKDIAANLKNDEENIELLLTELSKDNPISIENKLHEKKSDDLLIELEDEYRRVQAQWADFLEKSAVVQRSKEIRETKITNLEDVIKRNSDKIKSLREQASKLDPEGFQEQLVPLKDDIENRQKDVKNFSDKSEALTNQLSLHRKEYQVLVAKLDEGKRRFQSLTGRSASLKALQQESLGQTNEKENEWLVSKNIEKSKRLGVILEVEDGWGLAVELVLGAFLQAVCIDDSKIQNQHDLFESFSDGSLSLLFHSKTSSNTLHAETLASKIKSNAFVENLLKQVKIAGDFAEAIQLRSALMDGESLVTKDGIWLGKNWIKISNEKKSNGTILQRQKELVAISEELKFTEEKIKNSEFDLEQVFKKIQSEEIERESISKKLREKQVHLGELRERLGEKSFEARQMEVDLKKFEDEIQQLQNQMNKDEQNLREQKKEISEVIQAFQKDNEKREEYIAERLTIESELKKTKEKTESDRKTNHQFELKLLSIESQIESTRKAVRRLRDQYDELQSRQRALIENITKAEKPTRELDNQLESQLIKKAEAESSLAKVRSLIDQKEKNILESEKSLRGVEEDLEETRERIEKARLAKQTLQVNQANIMEQLQENDNALEEVLEELRSLSPDERDSSSLEEKLAQLNNKIERLGPINLAALDEYESQNKRKEYFDIQNEDLEKALNTLESAIKKIDLETKTRFKQTFDKVNTKLQDLFPKLFGGGSAQLEMNTDDILNSGVGIMARPPGKRNSNIQQLSGGEKALAAIALVFSIFDLNPAPFCLLDEVDAPLDDANVVRYLDLVKEMSKTVQFVFITHNKIAMEMGDHLMGVTMQESGVSRLVAVDMDEAVTMLAS
ncbi:MAG: chromosome segregation protein SMC [Pseudomonadota bacterium]|nr:chromosome segregation protein SMC [Pseudomonadota bacterium]